jgi:16S rRNA (cytosine967-C5)-methyltransferase
VRQRSPATPVRVRGAAADAVFGVVHEGRSLSRLLPPLEEQFDHPRDRALFKAIAFGTVRFQPRYRRFLDALLDRPLKRRAGRLEALLCVGLFQLDQMRMPPHAAVAETVNAVRAGTDRGAAGLANAVLRRFQREREKLYDELGQDPQVEWAIPAWWLERWRADWPQDWSAIASATNEQAPMWLRVNRTRVQTDDYLARLTAAGVGGAVHRGADGALRLEAAVDVSALPGFDDGLVSVQDGAAQLAAPLLDAAAGMRVLDACAAPGGKSAHLLERTPDIELLSLDVSAQRLEQVEQTLARLGLTGAPGSRRLAADAADPATWWDGRAFDRVLLDAPCSASGVIRRHPDIKLLRRSDDLRDLVSQQRRLLRALWPTVAPGGRLLYATCSVLRAENEAVVADFAADRDDLDVERTERPGARTAPLGMQILPGDDGMDGFYYASLRKTERAVQGVAPAPPTAPA